MLYIFCSAVNRTLSLTFFLLYRLEIQKRTADATGGSKPTTDKKYYDNHVCLLALLCNSGAKLKATFHKCARSN